MMPKIDLYESELLAAYDKGSFKSVATKSELAKFKAAARATAIKDQRINIRLSSGDLQDIQVKALEQGPRRLEEVRHGASARVLSLHHRIVRWAVKDSRAARPARWQPRWPGPVAPSRGPLRPTTARASRQVRQRP